MEVLNVFWFWFRSVLGLASFYKTMEEVEYYFEYWSKMCDVFSPIGTCLVDGR